ncbi:MAG: hypothetical protein ABI619_05290 [Betaproteobacteria bacterium]
MMNRQLASVIGLFVMGSIGAGQAMAHALTVAECTEGGEFIRNAALARDNGVTREFFTGKLEEDLALIRAFPPQLRWFAQDADDEKLLTDAVSAIFDHPLKAEQHEATFIGAYIEAAASTGEAMSRNQDGSI